MKYLVILLALITTAGCSVNDIVESTASTPQKFDLADSDRDGVIMARERCTGTVIGAAVDNYGCGRITDINERQDLKILFSNNSVVIDTQYYNQIERVAKIMTTYPTTKVTIEGHTSKRGSYELNLALSQKRAKAVIDVLENTFNIDPSRLASIGYSFDRPIDNSGTAEAEERNRRVVAEVTADDTIPEMRWNIYTVDEQID
ncbi:OmpA family protein [Shewanella livingstonensis]|uniref:OmpA family protein n=1 Tax=Shewanella livingstonensis TaxID=150120 RepID=A0A3G8LQP1_9GAMM|nr:OmpA family protein [Shewanella livingstonensis]AZG71936.1 OmpA family protein [Shewanella livingstonensis]